jgi:hypothetical protein
MRMLFNDNEAVEKVSSAHPSADQVGYQVEVPESARSAHSAFAWQTA